MVARHTRRISWHVISGCVCIDCGTRYQFTNTYKGNYCRDCHEAWITRQQNDPLTARNPPRFTPSTAETDGEGDDPVDLDEPYGTA